MVGFCCRHAAALLGASGFVECRAWPDKFAGSTSVPEQVAVSVNVSGERVQTRGTSWPWRGRRFAECKARPWALRDSVQALATKAPSTQYGVGIVVAGFRTNIGYEGEQGRR
jgi:hypothetical protein